MVTQVGSASVRTFSLLKTTSPLVILLSQSHESSRDSALTMSREDVRKVPLGLTKEFIRPLVLIAIPDRVKEYRAQLAKYETDKKKFEKIKVSWV